MNSVNYIIKLYIKRKYIILISLFVFTLIHSNKTFCQQIDPDGYNIFYYPNGNISSEGLFSGGKPQGIWKSYYVNGVLKSEGFKNIGQNDSTWKFYDESGRLSWTYDYKLDKKNGCARKFDTLQKITEEMYYVDNVIQGERIKYYETGEIFGIVNFVDGEESGAAYEFAKDGTIITEEIYDRGFLKEREVYNGFDEQGKKTGKWREFYPDGTIKTEANYRAGQMSGVYRAYDKKGKLVDIQSMLNDSTSELSPDLVMIDMYKSYYPGGKVKMIGGVADGLKNGIFREYAESGELINGYIFEKDTMVAEGMVRFDGNYEGEWREYFKTGEPKATGRYEDGIKTGKWTYFYKDGKKEQEGSFKANLPYSEWNWFYQNGTRKKQEFFNNKGNLEGMVTEWDSMGTELACGEYYDGRQEGSWFYHVGDFKEVGAYTIGLQNGIWNHYYKNGKKAFVGEFEEGQPKGKHVYYHKNGLKKTEGKYAGGEKQGIWKTFNERGEEIETIQYKHGEIIKINGFKVPPIVEA